MKRSTRPLDRRTFLKVSAFSAVAAASAEAMVGKTDKNDPDVAAGTHRILGRTGLKVSVVSLGAMRTEQYEVMQAAFDRGVNYVDTARCYMDGRNEEIVGKAIAGRRDNLIVATKFHFNPKKQVMIDSVEKSLKTLKTDYIDILQMHMPPPSQMTRDHVKEMLFDLRKQGKIRFIGVTTHSNMPACLNTAADDPDKIYDTVLTTYNDTLAAGNTDLEPAIEKAAKAGIGIIAMKTQKGGYTMEGVTPHQAMLRWVLKNPNITNAVPAMVDLQQVKEDTEVLNMVKMARADWDLLQQYNAAYESELCRLCDQCNGSCEMGVHVPTMNRALMYAEGYGDLALARTAFKEVPLNQTAMVCGNCSACTVRCPNGLDIAGRMQRTRTLLT